MDGSAKGPGKRKLITLFSTYQTSGWCFSCTLDFSGFHTQVFPHFSEKKELSGDGYPLVWYIIQKQLFTSVIFPSPFRGSANIHHQLPPLQ